MTAAGRRVQMEGPSATHCVVAVAAAVAAVVAVAVGKTAAVVVVAVVAGKTAVAGAQVGMPAGCRQRPLTAVRADTTEMWTAGEEMRMPSVVAAAAAAVAA